MFGHLLSKERLPFAGGACLCWLAYLEGCFEVGRRAVRCSSRRTLPPCRLPPASRVSLSPPPSKTPHCLPKHPPLPPAAYFGSLLATLYVSFVMHSYVFSLLFCVAQVRLRGYFALEWCVCHVLPAPPAILCRGLLHACRWMRGWAAGLPCAGVHAPCPAALLELRMCRHHRLCCMPPSPPLHAHLC